MCRSFGSGERGLWTMSKKTVELVPGTVVRFLVPVRGQTTISVGEVFGVSSDPGHPFQVFLHRPEEPISSKFNVRRFWLAGTFKVISFQ
jgi:hypothetical protein